MRYGGFIGPSYTLSSRTVDCQRTVGLFPETNEIGTGTKREVAALYGTPGLILRLTLGNGPNRGAWTASNDRCFFVSGNKLYEVTYADGIFGQTERGTLLTSSGPVSIADNGIHLMLVDGANGYTLQFSDNAYSQITDEGFEGGDFVVFQDGYFIVNVPGTGQYRVSELNGISWDGADIATAEGSPDKLLAVVSNHRDLWLLGKKSIEINYNSGNADFPFERIDGAFIEIGIDAPFSVAKIANTVLWLGGDKDGRGIVYMATGYQPERVSTHAIEQAIQKYDDIESATAWTYQENGHQFYSLNFPSAKTTWVFDIKERMWHERTYTNNGSLERHRAEVHAFAFGKHLVGDYQTGKIYEQSLSAYTDDGAPITSMRIAPHITNNDKLITYDEIQLDIQAGVGLDGTGQGTDPKIMMQYSDDGGFTYSNEQWRSAGKIGEYKSRARWKRLGQSYDRIFKLKMTDPVKRVWIGAELKMTLEAG